MTKLYATAIFCSTRLKFDGANLQQVVGDESDPEWRKHIERAYECALSSCFNSFYKKPIQVKHILSSEFEIDQPVGKVWSDWVFLEDKRLGTRSLHLNFCFPDLRVNLDNPACEATEAVSDFLADIYKLSEGGNNSFPGGLAELSEQLSTTARQRDHAPGISNYVYISLVCDIPGKVLNPSENVQANLYRLLFQHSKGVDAAVAKTMLPPSWGSASFFRIYSQPGGIVSVSDPYPTDEQSEYGSWFNPSPPELSSPPPPFIPDGTGQGGREKNPYTNYNLLPEYPPLRYLAVPVLQYGASHEETLREVHEAAFSKFFRWPFRWRQYVPFVREPTVCHLSSANLEGMRMPVVRGLLNQLLEIQLQERTTAASMERLRQRENRRNFGFTVFMGVVAVVGLLWTNGLINPGEMLSNLFSPAEQSEGLAAPNSAESERPGPVK